MLRKPWVLFAAAPGIIRAASFCLRRAEHFPIGTYAKRGFPSDGPFSLPALRGNIPPFGSFDAAAERVRWEHLLDRGNRKVSLQATWASVASATRGGVSCAKRLCDDDERSGWATGITLGREDAGPTKCWVNTSSKEQRRD